MPISTLPNEKPKRRWFQFRLRTLLALITLAAVGLGWVAYKRDQAQRESAAIVALEAKGAYIIDKPIQDFPPPVVRRLLRNDRYIALVDLYDSPVTDDDLRHFAALREVYGLKLRQTKITDAGLAHLAGLRHLQFLDLGHTAVSEVGLKHLSELRQLTTLDLAYTRVASLESLAGFTELEFLSVEKTPITDDDLVHLTGLASLTKLIVNGTFVSDAGHTRLQEALPNLEIVR